MECRREEDLLATSYLFKVGDEPHRYWRLYITNAGDSTCSASEISIFSYPNGPDFSDYIAIDLTSSSQFFNEWPPSNVFDNNSGTQFSFAANDWQGDGAYFQFDFGNGHQYTIESFSWRSRTDGYTNQTPLNGYVAFSDDAITWTPYWYYGFAAWNSTGQIQVVSNPGYGEKTPIIRGTLANSASGSS